MNIDGTFSEEEQLIHDVFKDYLETKIVPLQVSLRKTKEFPREIMKGISEIALPATIPQSIGGAGMPESTIGIMSELMGMYEFPIPGFLTMHFSKFLPLINNNENRIKYIEKYLAGELVLCGAFTEPGHGSDSAAIETKSTKIGEQYVVSGEKSFVSSPIMANAYIVTTKSGDKSGGINILFVDSKENGIEPYSMNTMATVYRGDFGGVRFDSTKTPAGNLIGEEGTGFKNLMRVLNVQRVHVALYSIGMAEKSLSEAVEYAKSRKAFGKPISKHQAVSFRLAESWSKLESVKLLAYKALAMQEKGLENSSECAAVKWYGCEVALEAVSNALQTFGAAGYVDTSPLEFRFRAARGFLIGDGTPDIQKLIISRKLFGKDYSP
jgi:alkylation response protein AidB-like acyl-CoA dehydrogenase